MGYIRHDVVIAASTLDDTLSGKGLRQELKLAVEELRKEIDNDEEFEKLEGISQIVVGPIGNVNGYSFYAFMPDGSKEAWGYSDRMDFYRDKFITLMSKDRWIDLVHIQFGGDGNEAHIIIDTNGER